MFKHSFSHKILSRFSRYYSSVYDYDICVIGGGPSGYAAAVRGNDFGKKVCLIEKNHLGGTGVYNGALSSKMMWRISREHNQALQLSKSSNDSIHNRHYRDIVNSIIEGQERKYKQILKQLENLKTSENNIKIDFYNGFAKFINSNEISISYPNNNNKENQVISSKNFIIATGSSPREPKQPKVDGYHIITSDHVLNLPHFPKSILIIGAGVIGCEFATIFANFGRTKVYLLNNRKSRLLVDEDEDLSFVISNNLNDREVEILNNMELCDAVVKNGTVICTLRDIKTGNMSEIRVEHCLYSIGRIPNTSNLDLHNAGVEVDSKGGILTKGHARSNIPHIFASGDVTADIGLVNVGEMEARHAVEVICSGEFNCSTNLSYQNIASIMFLEPEVACIAETGAKINNIPYRVGVYAFEMVNRAIINGKSSLGYVKMIVANDGSERLLGMRAIGPEASAIIGPAQLVIASGSKVSELEKVLFPHPAISESVQECARMFSGSSIMKPQCFVKLLRLEEVTPIKHEKTQKEKQKPVVPTYK